MSVLFGKSKCACGDQIQTKIKKPTSITPSVGKFECKHCGSKYLLTCAVESKVGPRSYSSKFKVLELSKIAEEIIQKRIHSKKVS